MRTLPFVAALAMVSGTMGCAMMRAGPPPTDSLVIPDVSLAWLAPYPLALTVEDERSSPALHGEELKAQLREIMSAGLQRSGVKLNEIARSSIKLRIERFGVQGDFPHTYTGCVSLAAEVRPADAEPLLVRGAECRTEQYRDRDTPRVVVHAAYQTALDQLFKGLAGADVIPLAKRPATIPNVKPPPRSGSGASVRGSSILVLDLRANGVERRVSALLTTLLLSQLDTIGGIRAIGASDVDAVLTAERQKELLGCSTAVCMAEIGGAIGANIVLYGEVGRLGTQYTLSLTAVSTRTSTPIARLSELTPTDEDALSRALPKLVDKLMSRIDERLAAVTKG